MSYRLFIYFNTNALNKIQRKQIESILFSSFPNNRPEIGVIQGKWLYTWQTSNNEIVSMLSYDPYTFTIFNVCTDENFRKRGLSKNLFNILLEHLRTGNVKSAFLFVESSNIHAIKMYFDLGFKIFKVTPTFELQMVKYFF